MNRKEKARKQCNILIKQFLNQEIKNRDRQPKEYWGIQNISHLNRHARHNHPQSLVHIRNNIRQNHNLITRILPNRKISHAIPSHHRTMLHYMPGHPQKIIRVKSKRKSSLRQRNIQCPNINTQQNNKNQSNKIEILLPFLHYCY